MTVRPGVVVRVLNALDGPIDSVTALNDSEEVVGIRLSSPLTRAFRWSAASGVNILPTPSGWSSEAFGLSNNGTVVGDVRQPPRQSPVEWLGGTVFRGMQILFPGASIPGEPPGCIVRGINAQGFMTGACLDPRAGKWWVAEWNSSGVIRDFCAAIECPFAGYGYAINSNEVIAGGPATDMPALNAFVIFQPNVIDTLPMLLGTRFGADVAFAINDKDIAAGQAVRPAGGCADPVVWQFTYQAALDIGGGNCGQANGIDNNFDVVGTVQAPSSQAFIWTQSTGIQALPGLGASGETSTAVAINGNREVLGTITSNGIKYDVIWTF